MVRRRLIALMLLPLAFAAVDDAWLPPALAKDGDSGGGGRGGGDDGGGGSDNSGRGGGDNSGGGDDDARAGAQTGSWGSTSSDRAHEAVSQGWALALSTILPTVVKAVPGQVLEVDLRQSWTGEWRYEFLVLTRDRRNAALEIESLARVGFDVIEFDPCDVHLLSSRLVLFCPK